MLKKALLVTVSAGLLSACANTWDVDAVRGMQPQGGAFETALFNAYADLAAEERTEQDWRDTAGFLEKARLAAAGNTVLPDTAGDRRLTGSVATEVEAARAALLSVLDANARTSSPELAARAQAGYECWVQELEEGHQAEDIAACKQRFDAAMAELTAAPAPAPTPEPAMVPGEYTINFALGKASLDAEAEATLNKAAADYAAARPARVVVAGHTDTVGDTVANLLLSQRRAEAVASYLEAKGVPTDALALEAYGEEQPAVPTGDDAQETRNRRVTITFSGS